MTRMLEARDGDKKLLMRRDDMKRDRAKVLRTIFDIEQDVEMRAFAAVAATQFVVGRLQA